MRLSLAPFFGDFFAFFAVPAFERDLLRRRGADDVEEALDELDVCGGLAAFAGGEALDFATAMPEEEPAEAAEAAPAAPAAEEAPVDPPGFG